jgi:hypothetical protein
MSGEVVQPADLRVKETGARTGFHHCGGSAASRLPGQPGSTERIAYPEVEGGASGQARVDSPHERGETAEPDGDPLDFNMGQAKAGAQLSQ